jgi:adenylate cyclase
LKREYPFLLCLMALMLLLAASCTPSSHKAAPKAVAGTLDLRNWDFAHDGMVPLNGEWRFYWEKLLSPSQLMAGAASDSAAYFTFPGSWNHLKKEGKEVGGDGFATFVLNVILPKHDRLLGFKSRSVNTAWRVWVDGVELGGAGTVGESKAAMVPATIPSAITFQPNAQEIQIVVQVSNFYHRKGGFWWPLQLGHHDQIQQARESALATELFLLGAVLIMGLYHLALYMLRSRDSSPLYFGIFCLLVGTRMLFVGENFYHDIFPWLNWTLAKKTEYTVTFFLTPFFFYFLNKLYPDEFKLRAARILLAFNGLLALLAILAPAPLFTLTPTIFNMASMVVFVVVLYSLILTIAHKREYAWPVFGGILILVLTTVNDMLNDSEIIRTGFYAPMGLFIFIFIQSYILSKRFAHAFLLAEVYANTFQKFVPRQFLDRIAKQGIGSIKLGNAEQAEVTILFSDIRSFTSISETLTPDGVLSFLNGFLSRMEPPIRDQGGFVDKYLGDAIMALFDATHHTADPSTSAIRAALGMQVALRSYNLERQAAGLPPIVCGIGLHTGSVIIGTIGGDERMDSTAIGDAVNLASRIESLTKHYHTDILASDATVNAIGARDQFLIRFVDKVRVVGKTVPVGLWEIAGLRGDAQFAAFEAMLPTFELALQHYFANDFASAQLQFENCHRQIPNDSIVQMYLDRCAQFLTTPPIAGWSGVTEMGAK